MNFRLKTSKYVADKLKQLQDVTNLTPNILARIAVALSLKNPDPISTEVPDSNGLEINRHTLTGGQDTVYKALVAQHTGREITDNEFFPTLFNAHLERGIRLLSNEYQHAGNSEKLIKNLVKNY